MKNSKNRSTKSRSFGLFYHLRNGLGPWALVCFRLNKRGSLKDDNDLATSVSERGNR